jgi:hypothetical protein
MPGFLLTADATVTCSHGGQVEFAPAQTRALAGGAPIATLADQLVVAGCPGIPASPGVVCTTVEWIGVASRVTASGLPVLVQSLPQGPGDGTVIGPPPPLPLVAEVQPQAVAT